MSTAVTSARYRRQRAPATNFIVSIPETLPSAGACGEFLGYADQTLDEGMGLRIYSWCLRRSGSAPIERAPPGRTSLTIVVVT